MEINNHRRGSMKKFFTIIFLLLTTTAANAQQIVSTVTEVISGDTFKIVKHKKPITIRIADIDCPELEQPGGQEAKRYTSQLLLGKVAGIYTNGGKVDNCTIGRVITNHGRDVAISLVQKGLAWPIPGNRNSLVNGQYKTAKKNKVGIWGAAHPEPPWEYRHRTHVTIVKKTNQRKISLYGDSALDIARDPDGSAVGEGGGMTIAPIQKTSGAEKVRSHNQQIFSSRSRGGTTSTYLTSDRKIRSACNDKWGTNYRMVKFCIEQQSTAKSSINGIKSTPTIKGQCRDKWGTNYRMVKFCIDQQTEAKKGLKHSRASLATQRRCEKKWGTNYRMVKFCIDQQVKAKRSLGY